MKTKTQRDGLCFTAEVTEQRDTHRLSERRSQACSKVSTQRESVRVQAVGAQQYSPSARCGGSRHAARVWRSSAAGAGH